MDTFDWKGYRPELDDIFFGDAGYIRYRSNQHDDFWLFFNRLIGFVKKSGKNLPKVNKAYNFRVGKLEEYTALGRKNRIPEERIRDFYDALQKYFNFCQKKAFEKLKKLRTQQENLPIAQHRQEILDTIDKNQVVLVAGDTGCGKSTQVPQYLLRHGFVNIACTQPRRIAAISLSKRVGYETLNQFGSLVGYKIRFDSTKTSRTKILFLTEGLLLRQMQTDTTLAQYSIIILDEVHERHLQSDFLLGMFKTVLHLRKDLKLVLMSATINLKLFKDYFKDAPVIQVPGRLYPIKVKYFPISLEDKTTATGNINPVPFVRILQLIDKKYSSKEFGDLLIFLSGMTEISNVAEAAQRYADETGRWIILCLHSTLSISDQDKVFDIPPEGVRKCILSTNIAETSVTIDGIRFVADSGKVKEMSYDDHSKMQTLKECWVSRASAEQRKGRAGRTGPGVCFRLYSEDDYEALIPYSIPEILRLPLANLILQMKTMNIIEVRKFEFIEPPAVHAIENYVQVLKAQAALDSDENLTPIGNVLAQLPLDIVMGKLLIMGSLFDMVDLVMSCAAVLSIQSPFTFNAYRNFDATERRKELESDHGDPFTLLNIFTEWIKLKGDKRENSKKWCKKRCVEEQRFYEAINLRAQFKTLLESCTLLQKKAESDHAETSHDRKKRHSDKISLRKVQEKQRLETRKPKRLKLTADREDSDDEANDIHNLKFNIKNDATKLAAGVDDIRKFTRRDLRILKLVLCSSLYPQLAIADEHNSYQTGGDLVYHTPTKMFVTLHPTGYFANNVDVLDPHEGKKRNVSTKKGWVSSRHQLLAYVSLLETKKPYLCNTLRVPALQSSTMFSQTMDLSSDCRRIVCDAWVEFIIQDKKDAESLIFAILRLRRTWDDLLKLKLSGENESKLSLKLMNDLKSTLTQKLGDFLESHVKYTMYRLTSTDKKNLYDKTEHVIRSKSNTAIPEATPVKTREGKFVTNYLMYNSIVCPPVDRNPDEVTIGDFTHRDWKCDECENMIHANTYDRLCHQLSCSPEMQNQDDEDDMPISKSDSKLHKHYWCDVCNRNYNLSAVEILKHKRSHIT